MVYVLINEFITSNYIGMGAFCGTLTMIARLDVTFYIQCKFIFTMLFLG